MKNTGSLDLAGVAINATPWYVDPVGAPPYGAGHAALPPTLTELSTAGPAPAPRSFVALSADGTAPPPGAAPLAAGLPPDGDRSLWFRINLDGRPGPDGAATLVQFMTYVAECASPQ